MNKAKKKYAQVGMGARSGLYIEALTSEFSDAHELVAVCDTNTGRMDLANRRIKALGGRIVPTYAADAFDVMIQERTPDIVIVTTGPDTTHCDYICRAMSLGCNVITEKPMAVNETQCRKILETSKQTGKTVRVAFNYRYAPYRSQVKEILSTGAIGEILSVDFAWLLSTGHGADYFRRWHRRRANSGSLLVHKATHHFDLVNWWLEDRAEEVYCHGTLKYYTPQTAQRLGLADHSERCRSCIHQKKCNFYLDLAEKDYLKEMYLDCEAEDGYFRDKCVFSEEIDIWDNMSATVRYRKGTVLNYMLHAYSPYEGYSIAFNGSKGRLEHFCCERSYISGDGSTPGDLVTGQVSIKWIPEFSSAREMDVRTGSGGHGGADPLMISELLSDASEKDPLDRQANGVDGANSVLIGVAAGKSIDKGTPVSISGLLNETQ